ncbi:YeiH family protein [Stenotrophomonas tumulicola]|uniref:YeiH family putative sulfate export transporter n=1 Tax=Stenotrophomonas tumulicola TaxID=1685415 RepID=A0A7W3FNV7_9GAMM|nr:YeiH family protein [Stenotrophomonas tumulicola]MBA8682681.1 YeiH family putative sulfate export transporter [Stenotrophomonas tumulicola]
MNLPTLSRYLPSPLADWRPRLPGLLLVGLLAAASLWLAGGRWAQAHGVSALTLSILGGIVVGNSVYAGMAGLCEAGVGFAKHWLLRAGIVLYGLRLTFQDIGQVGPAGVAIDVLVVASTFGLACWLGTRVFKLQRDTAMLIGAGSAICGAAAVMAAGPVVRGRASAVTVAVSTVVVFGTLAMFLYPALYRFGLDHGWLAMDARQFGVYTGATVHEVAQVVAAGRAVGEAAADTAVITKMVRVMLLAPFLVLLSAALSRQAPQAGGGRAPIMVPWFAFGFVVVAGLNSLHLLPGSLHAALLQLDTILLAMAMAALGLATQVSALREAGLKPLLLAACLFAWLVIGGGAIHRGVTMLG